MVARPLCVRPTKNAPSHRKCLDHNCLTKQENDLAADGISASQVRTFVRGCSDDNSSIGY